MSARALLLVAIVAFTPVFAGCSNQSQFQAVAASVERELAWVEAANPTAMLEADIRAGHQRFLSVCGYACIVPGVGKLTAERCYPSVLVQTIEGTSDAPVSERHAALNQRAADVAAEYNTLSARALTFRGRARCPQGANWDAAFNELHALARAVHPALGEADFSLSATEPTFLLVLPERLHSPAFEASACAVLRKHNLPPTARIVLHSHRGEARSIVLCGAPNAA